MHTLPVCITRNLRETSLIPRHKEMDRAQTPDPEYISVSVMCLWCVSQI